MASCHKFSHFCAPSLGPNLPPLLARGWVAFCRAEKQSETTETHRHLRKQDLSSPPAGKTDAVTENLQKP